MHVIVRYFLCNLFLLFVVFMSPESLLGETNSSLTISLLKYFQLNDINKKSLLNPNNDILVLRKSGSVFEFNANYLLNIGEAFKFTAKFVDEYSNVNSSGFLNERKSDWYFNNWYFNELFFSVAFSDRIFLDVGKEVLNFGCGFGWNPSNFLEKYGGYYRTGFAFDDPDNNPYGVSLAKLKYYGDKISASFVWLPRINIDKKSKAINDYFDYLSNPNKTNLCFLQNSIVINGLNVTFLLGLEEKLYKRPEQGFYQKFGLSGSKMVGNTFSLHAEVGLRNGSGKMCPVKKEDIYELEEEESSEKYYSSSLIGARYFLSNDFELLLEYYFTGKGYGKKEAQIIYQGLENSREFYREFAYFRLFPVAVNTYYEFANFRRNYLLSSLLRNNINQVMDFRIYNHLCLDDGSGFVTCELIYRPNDRLSFEMLLGFPWGKSNTEFGMFYNRYCGIFKVLLYL